MAMNRAERVKSERTKPERAKQSSVQSASAGSNLRALTPTKPIRETYTLIPGVKVTVVASPDKWPNIKKDGAYVSIDAAPAEANPTRDARDVVQSQRNSRGQQQRNLRPQPDLGGDPTIPGATIAESLPGDDQAADRMAASMELSPASQNFLRQAERSILHKEEL